METGQAVTALAALAQSTRLAIFRLLVQTGPTGLAAGEIGAATGTAPATLSFHLKELARAGLVEARQAGRFIYYAASFTAMNELLAFLTDNCCARDGVSCTPVCRTGSPPSPAPPGEPPRAAQRGRRRTTAR